MGIAEAVKAAMEADCCITLPEFRNTAKIKPTNDVGNCIVMKADGSQPSKCGWQPSARDLLRNDWEIVD